MVFGKNQCPHESFHVPPTVVTWAVPRSIERVCVNDGGGDGSVDRGFSLALDDRLTPLPHCCVLMDVLG